MDTECYIFRYERQYSSFHGNWISIRIASLSASDPRARLIQCVLWRIHKSTGYHRPYFCVSCTLGSDYHMTSADILQPHLPSMGYGLYLIYQDLIRSC